ncbi:RbsD/FucU family protein [Poriferisphaera sp. WC338]|uniref:RbsD/FucU family protein n=1 Tax=Poriferisphaera sp. WC338 TaxID=3425129 RepID=UPI003D8176FF
MLKGKLIHPDILAALGRAGHSARILIADGNYPFSTTLSPNAELINLNLSPGLVSCTDALDAILSAVPIEAAHVMQYASEGPYALEQDPEIWQDFRKLLPTDIKLDRIERFAFYEAASKPDVAITIATGEQRIYANILLTIGVNFPE